MSWRDQLFDENSLWDVYKLARLAGRTKFNFAVSSSVTLIILAFVILNVWCFNGSIVEIGIIADNIRTLSGDGISFSTQLLGFLVAGFTIFATVTRPEIFEKLAKTKYENTNALKYIFFCFMIVFIHYVCFLFFCVIIKVLFSKGSPGSAILYLIDSILPIRSFVIYSALIVMANWFIFLVLVLKSFIWNVYTTILLVIAASAPNE